MSSKIEYEKKLMRLKIIIEDRRGEGFCKSMFSGMAQTIEFDMPVDVCNILRNADEINSNINGIFLGFDAFSVKEVQESYRDKNSIESFFSAYDVDNDFNIQKGRYIVMEDDLAGELEGNFEIKSAKCLLPVFQFQGDFLVFNFEQKVNLKGLAVITNGYLGNMLAPSITAHIEDLMVGLKTERYRVVDEGLVYPSSWYLRQKVISGELEMDDYGEVEE